MSNDNTMTFHGRVGTKVELREGSVPWVLFRVASTPSYFDQATRTWRDLETIWISVKAWRSLAQNVAESLEVGDPIVVIGKVRTEKWTTQDGEPRESTVLEANLIGHDLTWGVTKLQRVERQSPATAKSDDTVAALARARGRVGRGACGLSRFVGSGSGSYRLGHMADYVFTLRNVRKKLGEKVVLDDVTLSFLHGAKIGVVGPNGTGKSTLFKIMAGLEQPNNGDAIKDPDASVGILLQEPPLTEGKTVLENVEEAVGEIKAKIDRFNKISEELADPDADYDTLLPEMGELQTDLDHANAWDLDSRLAQAMDALRCPPPDELVDHLSGGERRRVALCKLLLEQPDLLLLDEPTNHLDAESVLWLEQHLASYPGAVLAITHDRYFLDNVAEWILELDRGKTHPYEGNYSTYLETKQARLVVEGKKDAKRAKILAKELEWVRSNAKARQVKNQARLEPLRGDGRRGRARPQARLRGDQHPGRARGSAMSSSTPRTCTRASVTVSCSTV